MTYELQVERVARRELDRLPRAVYERVAAAIDNLADEPRPRGARKLRRAGPLLRIRIGAYRVVYAVFDREHLVKVLRVRRRTGQTYEGL